MPAASGVGNRKIRLTGLRNNMNSASQSVLLELRILVGFLGEQAQFAWWPTKFFEASSRLFLEPVFAKTSVLAQYHGVLEAARRQHDEHLNVGSYHLFRLPEEIEQDLHASLQSGAALPSPLTKESALASLAQLAESNAPAAIGPVSVGDIKNLRSPDVLAAIAGIYASAFDRDAKSYPYLVG